MCIYPTIRILQIEKTQKIIKKITKIEQFRGGRNKLSCLFFFKLTITSILYI